MNSISFRSLFKRDVSCLRHSWSITFQFHRIIIRRYKMSKAYGFIDNGTGMPDKAVDKIFQPFFTTKPTGQGTGLGLSLSYDIVKAHGGELKVQTKEGEGAEFTIQLPLKQI